MHEKLFFKYENKRNFALYPYVTDDKNTNRQTDNKDDVHINRQRQYTKTDRQTNTKTDRQTNKHKAIQTDKHLKKTYTLPI